MLFIVPSEPIGQWGPNNYSIGLRVSYDCSMGPKGPMRPLGLCSPGGWTVAGGQRAAGQRRSEPPEHTSEQQQDGSKPHSRSRLVRKSNMYFTLGWQRHRLLIYSAGRKIVLGNAQTTQITTKCLVATAAHRPTEASLVPIFVLLGHFSTLLPYQQTRQMVYCFPAKSRRNRFHDQFEITTTISLLGCIRDFLDF